MSVADELHKLQQLRESGAINDGEFAQAKAKVLNGSPAAHSSFFEKIASAPSDPAALEQQTRLWATLLHLSILAGYAAPIAGLALPIVIWQLKKADLPGLDVHGKNAMNWIISHLIYLVISLVLVPVLIGIPLVLAVGAIGVIFPIIAGIKANNGEVWKYPLSITFIK